MSVDEHHLPPPTEDDEFWLFGYGSLIWKPPPHFESHVSPTQKSEDHRGTPSAPGRVVTLIDRAHWDTLGDAHHSAPDRVWGCAYRIERARVAEVKDYLDIREINGYTIHYTPFHPAAAAAGPAPAIRTLVYIGTPDNAQFTGPQDVGALAEHIYRSEGPSGLNRDYLWGLERALGELGPESGDDHVSDLSARVRAIAKRVEQQQQQQQKRQQGDAGSSASAAVDGGARPHHHHEFHRVTSVEESEETEKAD